MAEDKRGATQDLPLAPRERSSNHPPQGEKLLDFTHSFYHLSEIVIICCAHAFIQSLIGV